MRLIDSDKLLPRLWDYISDADYEKVEKVISEMPSAQPERKTGKWIYNPGYALEWICSECDSSSMDRTDYCPMCGTKMEVE